MKRISFDEYAINLAIQASSRSEDMYRKVGAVALNKENGVIAIAYNGTPSGYVMPEDLASDRDRRRPFMIHAETNLCALFKRGEVETVAVTCCPCSDCFRNLIASGVKRVIYKDDYTDFVTSEIASIYSPFIKLEKYDN